MREEKLEEMRQWKMNKRARTRGQSKLIDHVLEVLGIKKSPVKREGEREKSRGVL